MQLVQPARRDRRSGEKEAEKLLAAQLRRSEETINPAEICRGDYLGGGCGSLF